MRVLHIYSNTPELLTDLEAVTWTVRRADLQDEPTLSSTEWVATTHTRDGLVLARSARAAEQGAPGAIVGRF